MMSFERCVASKDALTCSASPTPSTDNCSETLHDVRQAREDTRGRHHHPARPAQTPHTDASDKSRTRQQPPYNRHLTQRGAV